MKTSEKNQRKNFKITAEFLKEFPHDYEYKEKAKKILADFKKLIVKPITNLKSKVENLDFLTEWATIDGEKYCGYINPFNKEKQGFGKEINKNKDFIFGLYKNNSLAQGCVIKFEKKKILLVSDENSRFLTKDFSEIEGDGVLIFLGRNCENWAFKGKIKNLMPNGFGVLYECNILKKDQLIRGKAYKSIGKFENGLKRGNIIFKYFESIKVKKLKYKENSLEQELDFNSQKPEISEKDTDQSTSPVIGFVCKIEEEDYIEERDTNEFFLRKSFEEKIEKYDKIDLFCQPSFDFEDETSFKESSESAKESEEEVELVIIPVKNEFKDFDLVQGKEIVKYYYKNFTFKIDFHEKCEYIIDPIGSRIYENMIFYRDKVIDNRNNEITFQTDVEIFSLTKLTKNFLEKIDMRKLDNFTKNYVETRNHQLYEKYFPFALKFYDKKRLFFIFKSEEKYFILLEDSDFRLTAEIQSKLFYKGTFFNKKQVSTLEGIFTFHPQSQRVIPIKGGLKSIKNEYSIDIIQIIDPSTEKVSRFIKKIKAVFVFGYTVDLKSEKINEKYQQLKGTVCDINGNEIYNGVIFQEKFIEEENQIFVLYTEKSTGFSFKDIRLIYIEEIFEENNEKFFRGQIFNIAPFEKGATGIFTYTIPPKEVKVNVVNFLTDISYKVERTQGGEIITEYEMELPNFYAKFYDIEKNKTTKSKCELGIEDPKFEIKFNNVIKIQRNIKLEKLRFKEKENGRIDTYNLISRKVQNFFQSFFNIPSNYKITSGKFPLKFKLDFSQKEDIKLFISENKNKNEESKGVILLKDGGIITTTLKNNFKILEKNISVKRYELRNDGLCFHKSIYWIQGKLKGNFIFGSNTRILYKNLASYEGRVLFDRRHGRGNIEFLSKEVYEGEWFDGLKHGYGKYIWGNGDVYEGEFKLNLMNGNGVLNFRNGIRLEGEFIGGDFFSGSCFKADGSEFKVVAGKFAKI